MNRALVKSCATTAAFVAGLLLTGVMSAQPAAQPPAQPAQPLKSTDGVVLQPAPMPMVPAAKDDTPNDGKKRVAPEFDEESRGSRSSSGWPTSASWRSSTMTLRRRPAPSPSSIRSCRTANPRRTRSLRSSRSSTTRHSAPATLLRRNTGFRVVPADVPIDKELLQQVTRSELDDHGRNEIVILELQLKTLNAEDLAPETKKFLGAFGEVTPLPSTNQLIMQGKVEQLQHGSRSSMRPIRPAASGRTTTRAST